MDQIYLQIAYLKKRLDINFFLKLYNFLYLDKFLQSNPSHVN